MTQLNDYLDLIDSERNRRPAEAMLADEIRRLRLALEVIADRDHFGPACICEAATEAEAALKASYSDIADDTEPARESGEQARPG